MQFTIPAQRVSFSKNERAEILKRVDECLRLGSVAQGKNVAQFEEIFAEKVGAKHAVALSSGGAAIEVAMYLLGVKGHQVLVPTNTFLATAAGVMMAGGSVKLVDVSEDTFSLTLDSIKLARTSKTVGVIVVHIGGIITPEIEAIRDYCSKNGLWFVEDCAHAHGSNFKGHVAGTFGVMGAYSFFATKVVTSGEGGMLVTNDNELASHARRFRDYGKAEQWVTLNKELGVNRRMSEFCAAVGAVRIRRLEQLVEERKRVATQYTKLIRKIPNVRAVLPCPDSQSSWYKYIVLLDKDVDRERLRTMMAEQGISLPGGVYDVPLHKQPVFKGMHGKFPVAEDICSRHICLPIYSGLSDKEVRYVIDSLSLGLKKLKKGYQ